MEFHGIRVERRAIGELHPVTERKRDLLLVRADRPRTGEPRLHLAGLIEIDEAVEQEAAERLADGEAEALHVVERLGILAEAEAQRLRRAGGGRGEQRQREKQHAQARDLTVAHRETPSRVARQIDLTEAY